MKEHYSHGEVVIFEINSLPKTAKRLEKTGELILADSETTGNHHCVKIDDNVEVFQKSEVFYIKNTKPVDVYCKLKDRHDTITLQPSIWEIDKAKEYDYITQEQRNVAD